MAYSEINLGIVCPMANESENAELFVRDVLQKCRVFRFNSINFYAICDNASNDNTLNILYKLSNDKSELNVVFAPENRCVVDAYVRGYREAINAECDWILEIDAEFTHNPGDISKFFTKMSDGYDCVFGSRYLGDSKVIKNSISRSVISRGGSILTNLLIGTKLNDMTSGFELFTRRSLESILDRGIFSKGPFFQTEIKTIAHDFKIAEVPISYISGSRKINVAEIRDALKNLLHLFLRRLNLS